MVVILNRAVEQGNVLIAQHKKLLKIIAHAGTPPGTTSALHQAFFRHVADRLRDVRATRRRCVKQLYYWRRKLEEMKRR